MEAVNIDLCARVASLALADGMGGVAAGGGCVPTALTDLPTELLGKVLRGLPVGGLVHAAEVCIAWRRVGRQQSTWAGQHTSLRGRKEGLSGVPDAFLNVASSLEMWGVQPTAPSWRFVTDADKLPERARAAARAEHGRIMALGDHAVVAQAFASGELDRLVRRTTDACRDALVRLAFGDLMGRAYHQDLSRLCVQCKDPLGQLVALDLSGAEPARAESWELIAFHLAPQLEKLVCNIDSVGSALVNTAHDGGRARRAFGGLLRRATRLAVLAAHGILEADELLAVADATRQTGCLRMVDCSWSQGVTDEAVSRLAAAAPDLQKLTYVTAAPGRALISALTERGVSAIRQGCPGAALDIRLFRKGPLDNYVWVPACDKKEGRCVVSL